MRAIEKILTWRLFVRQPESVRVFDIIKWWEVRRAVFNVLVGATGLVTLTVGAIVITASEKIGEPLELPDPPIVIVFFVILYGIAANVCYTGGWIAEIVVTRIWQGRAGAFYQISFALGLVFSVLLTLLPLVLVCGLFAGFFIMGL